MQFTDDEIETIKAIIEDHGCNYGLTASSDKVWALGIKLGIRDPILPPTEELKRQVGFQISKLVINFNEYFAKMEAQNRMKDHAFISGEQWPVGTSFKD